MNSRFAAVMALGVIAASSPPLKAQPYQGPITITAGGTYTGNWQSLDPNTPAVTVQTTAPVVIVYSNIQSKGDLISVQPGSDLTVTDTSGTGLNPGVPGAFLGRFLTSQSAARLVIENNDLNNTAGIYIRTPLSSSTISIRFNTVENINGRASTGSGYATRDNGGLGVNLVQFVQFDNVVAPAAEIAWNQVINDPYVSRVEDNISIYRSCGSAAAPIDIHDNFIHGGYPGAPGTDDYSGGGIIEEGTDACFVNVHDNQIIETTNYGIAIAGAHDNNLYSNTLMGIGLLSNGVIEPSQNVGGYVSSAAYNNTVHDNRAGWYNQNGDDNTWYPRSPCDSSCFYNNTSLIPFTQADEDAQFNVWNDKLANNGIVIGVRQ